MKVLIVEDEIRIREGLVKLIEKIDSEFEVVGEAVDGASGLEMCKVQQPDIIITDIKMPKMDGLQMLSEIYGSGLKSKAIVISAYSEFEYARGAMKLGVTEYLLKPISLMDFSKAINNIAEQIYEDRRKKPEQVGTLEQIVRDIMFGHTKVSSETIDYFQRNGVDVKIISGDNASTISKIAKDVGLKNYDKYVDVSQLQTFRSLQSFYKKFNICTCYS